LARDRRPADLRRAAAQPRSDEARAAVPPRDQRAASLDRRRDRSRRRGRGRGGDACSPRVPAPVLRARVARSSVISFGVQGSGPLVGGEPPPGHFRRIAETAEGVGFDSLWAGDHVAFHEPLLDITVALSTFAAVTERIRLGAGVLLLPLRAPAI